MAAYWQPKNAAKNREIAVSRHGSVGQTLQNCRAHRALRSVTGAGQMEASSSGASISSSSGVDSIVALVVRLHPYPPGCPHARAARFHHGTLRIRQVDDDSFAGDILSRMLKAQGADVAWAESLPDGSDALKGNEKAAAFISKMGKRPGRRLSVAPAVLQCMAAL